MAGKITHEWVGTTLFITSDSGTSGCDLVGPVGDTGIRGPQGEPGVDAHLSFSDLTDEQRETLRGPQGIQGPAFTYDDFTPEQLESIRGPQGPQGPSGHPNIIFSANEPDPIEGQYTIWLRPMPAPTEE